MQVSPSESVVKLDQQSAPMHAQVASVKHTWEVSDALWISK